jgi:hypothetical protein
VVFCHRRFFFLSKKAGKGRQMDVFEEEEERRRRCRRLRFPMSSLRWGGGGDCVVTERAWGPFVSI